MLYSEVNSKSAIWNSLRYTERIYIPITLRIFAQGFLTK